MPEFIVTTKHSVLSRFKVTARTKYDAVAALTDARHKGEGLPESIQVAGVESSVPQIHSVGVVKDAPGDEPEAPADDVEVQHDGIEAPAPTARPRGK